MIPNPNFADDDPIGMKSNHVRKESIGSIASEIRPRVTFNIAETENEPKMIYQKL